MQKPLFDVSLKEYEKYFSNNDFRIDLLTRVGVKKDLTYTLDPVANSSDKEEIVSAYTTILDKYVLLAFDDFIQGNVKKGEALFYILIEMLQEYREELIPRKVVYGFDFTPLFYNETMKCMWILHKRIEYLIESSTEKKIKEPGFLESLWFYRNVEQQRENESKPLKEEKEKQPLSLKQKVLLLHELKILEQTIFEQLPGTKQGKIFSLLFGSSYKNTYDSLRNRFDPKEFSNKDRQVIKDIIDGIKS